MLADALARRDRRARPLRRRPAGHAGDRALIDPRTPAPSLDVLGRCSRQASCEGDAAGGGLPAKLHLLNGELINRKIAARDGRLHRLIAAGQVDDEIVAEFYLRALGRPPDRRGAAALAVASWTRSRPATEPRGSKTSSGAC